MKNYRFLIIVWITALGWGTLSSCGNGAEVERLQRSNANLRSQNRQLQQQVNDLKENEERLAFLAEQMQNVKARIITNHGNIELSFFPELAPIHCFNFITRAESGFYNGTKFHRVIPGFMIQGGDPASRSEDRSLYGQGGPVVSIPHEFNQTPHRSGILSMARTSNLQTGAGSQFFIMHGRSSNLDNEYTAFGQVTSGMRVVDEIANLETSREFPDQPIEHVIIEQIEVYR
ncbi:MAG: peptidylprolyl isomerase [Balneolales bacterium]